MQFTTVFTILAAAMTAAAMPSSRILARNGDDGGETNTVITQCSAQGNTAICCNGFAAACVLDILSPNCNTEVFCCEGGDNSVQNGLINVDARCAKIL